VGVRDVENVFHIGRQRYNKFETEHKIERGGKKMRRRKGFTQVQEQAYTLCQEDRLLDEEIARSLGVSRRTLARWKHTEEWERRQKEAAEAWKAAYLAEMKERYRR
jgi:transcriptional regulator with XRE-family HTH domain